jgi:hypothetical protein
MVRSCLHGNAPGSSLFNHELLPSLPPSPSHRPHLPGRCDGEGGRENPPVEPELSTSVQWLDSIARSRLPPFRESVSPSSRSWSRGLHSQAAEAGGFVGSPTLRVGPSFYACRSVDRSPGMHSFHNDSKPELAEASPSDPRRWLYARNHFRSLPPALSALDSTLRPTGTLNALESWLPHSVACDSRRLLGKHDLLRVHLRSGWYLTGLEVLP